MTVDILEQQIYALPEEMSCRADIGSTEEELEIDKQGTRSLFTQMPESGTGFICYGPIHKRYGHSEVIRAIQHICQTWQKAYPNGPRLGVGNISLEAGGFMDPHESHQKGVDVDIAPVSNTHEEIPVTWHDLQYSRDRTQQLIDLIHRNPVLKIRTILFNDPDVRGVSSWSGHDNHLHVSFFPPSVPESLFSSDQDGSLRLTNPFMKGDRVRQLQESLIKAGIEVSADAIFGNQTDAAVRKFQAQYGLDIDGKVGAITLAKLEAVKDPSVPTVTIDPSANSSARVASGILLQAVIDQNQTIDFSDLNHSDLLDHPDLCREIQIVLQANGLLDTVDGIFGLHTQGAIRSFKAAHQLPGGDLINATTASVLLLTRPLGGTLPLWQGGDETATIQAIVQESNRHGIVAKSQIAYILATVEHESAGSFQPVREAYFLGEPNAENHRKTLSYYPFYGRGYVQLTWDYHYRSYSTLLGVDLVNQPDLAMRPDIALFVLIDGMKRGVFTGVKLDHYITERGTDFVNARRIVNGTDKAREIASLADSWSSTLA